MAKFKWNSTSIRGIRYREHPTRKHGVKKDRYFAIRYQKDGKRREAALGWASEGWTIDKAFAQLSMLKEAAITGEGHTTLKDKRQAAERKQQQKKAKRISLDEYWCSAYLAHAQRTKKKSWHKEESHYRNHLSPLLGKTSLCDISMHHWDSLVSRLTSQALSERSIEYISGTLRRVLRHAHDRGITDSPPPSGKKVGASAPTNNRRMRIITPEEKVLILNELKISDLQAWRITLFAFLTGCRASEAFSLEWRNVTANGITFENTKNSESRTIPMSTPLRELIASIATGAPTEKVFTNAHMRTYKEAPSPFRTAVSRLGLNEDRARLDCISFHSIRHTVATELAKQIDIRSLMDIMGWKVPAMALRYMHGNSSAKQSALDNLQ